MMNSKFRQIANFRYFPSHFRKNNRIPIIQNPVYSILLIGTNKLICE